MTESATPMKTERVEFCPKCHAPDPHREEVDIGVGVLKGPMSCENCGYRESPPEMDWDDDDWILDPDMEDK